MPLELLITSYGYPVILLGTFLEGETILVMGGYLAHRGYLELPWVMAAAMRGTLAGDQLFYFIGRHKGPAFLSKRPAWQSKAERVHTLLQRHRIGVILAFRFLYGLRTATPFLIGSSGLPPARFAVLNVIGAALWTIVVGMLGYTIGLTVELFLEEAKRYELFVLGGIVLAGCISWLIYYIRARKSS